MQESAITRTPQHVGFAVSKDSAHRVFLESQARSHGVTLTNFLLVRTCSDGQLFAHNMVGTGKPTSISEQDISQTSTRSGKLGIVRAVIIPVH